MQFKKMQGFGPKLVDRLKREKPDIETFTDIVTAYDSESALIAAFGDTGSWIWNICHGRDAETTVESVDRVKKFGSSMNLARVSLKMAKGRLRLVAAELLTRIDEDRDTCKRIPTQLGVNFRCRSSLGISRSISRSVVAPMTVLDKARELKNRITSLVSVLATHLPIEKGLTFTNIGVYAAKFEENAKKRALNGSILSFARVDPSNSSLDDQAAATSGMKETGHAQRFVHADKKRKLEHNLPKKQLMAAKLVFNVPQRADNAVSSSSSSGASFECKLCYQQVPENSREEHQDFHVALSLSQKIERPKQSKGKKSRKVKGNIASFFK
jgi:hypothetical protein